MSRCLSMAVVPIAVVLLVGCSQDDVPGNPLTYDMLMNGFDDTSPLNEAALTIPQDAGPPHHVFQGRLDLHGEDVVGQIAVISGNADVAPEESHLPEFDFEFVQSAGYLIPKVRGLIIADHVYWNIIIGPGRAWQQAGDRGYTRASFPFGLAWKGSNGILNGTMTFLFDDTRVSKVWYQITQETTVSFSADLWGLLDATYHRGPVADADAIAASFTRELAERLPTKPIETLAQDFPGVDITAFGAGITPEHMTWYGFVVNGINYVGGCRTRYGIYPYCDEMRAPSYSTAKSAFASVALMRLAQKYNIDAPGLLIKDHVPEASESPGDWDAVTFNHVLDMSTGNFGSSEYMVDEEDFSDPFWTQTYYAEKIAAAFNWPNSALPGTQWVYRTCDTFILTRALHNYLQAQEGAEADIFEFAVDEVYKPLKIGPGAYATLRTEDDNWQGQPYGGYGMWWIPDDIAKLAAFLNVHDGTTNGVQLLHPDMLAATLQRNPDDRGVDTPWGKYNNGFWANEVTYGCTFWITEMMGYSGVVVVLMPNGTAYYYASDNREFTWEAAVAESDKIAPFCPMGS
ncbi:MAG: serine hydrolase domain-containing protein [Myxococcota bacterium]|nr:serine hydrolase domain-containing protein [Myxococcota bacterium]